MSALMDQFLLDSRDAANWKIATDGVFGTPADASGFKSPRRNLAFANPTRRDETLYIGSTQVSPRACVNRDCAINNANVSAAGNDSKSKGGVAFCQKPNSGPEYS